MALVGLEGATQKVFRIAKTVACPGSRFETTRYVMAGPCRLSIQ